ncbi:MAG: AraC family transcriptional regulator [Acidobacteriota bacterium]|nr:AraC family transcriptional regulator [Acidobacteriota bacterium]
MKETAKNEWIKVWKPNGFDGVQINQLNFATSRTSIWHIHEDYVFGFVEQGSIQLECNYCRQTHLLTAGSLTVAEAGEIFSSRNVGQAPWRMRSIKISAKRLNSIYNSITGDFKTLPHFSELTVRDHNLKRLFLNLHGSFTKSATRLESDSLLLGWVSAITLPYAEKPDFGFLFRTNSETTAVKRVREYISENVADNIALEDLARIARLSPYHLHRLFHRQVGLPPHAYQNQLRIAQAQKLLADGKSISDAAFETGFADQSHFTRFFKRYAGVTPGKYLIQ